MKNRKQELHYKPEGVTFEDYEFLKGKGTGTKEAIRTVFVNGEEKGRIWLNDSPTYMLEVVGRNEYSHIFRKTYRGAVDYIVANGRKFRSLTSLIKMRGQA